MRVRIQNIMRSTVNITCAELPLLLNSGDRIIIASYQNLDGKKGLRFL